MMKNIKRLTNIALAILMLVLGVLLYVLLRSTHVVGAIAQSPFASLLKWLFILYIVVIAFYIVLSNNNPNKIISWLVLLFAFPYVGFIAYLTFGRSFRKERIAKAKKAYMHSTFHRRASAQRGVVESAKPFKLTSVTKKLAHLLNNNANAPFYKYNDLKLYTEGTTFFDDMLEDMMQAVHHIHLEYYIIRHDQTGQRLKQALIDKAKVGVEVRVIYDSVGSWQLGDDYIDELKAAGVEVYPFLPTIIPVLGRELNYRNHRKITVIDGKIGYIGGMNIGDEYLGLSPLFGFWRDTHMRIAGDAVQGLQNYFMVDWAFVSEITLPAGNYITPTDKTGQAVVQIAASGPDTDWEVMLQAYFTMITNAVDRIWITTPYLVPDESILVALKTAALAGVDVRILIPAKADHFMVYWATRANLKPVLEAGVKIYCYENGFVHSKTIIVDRAVVSVGSANLDMRSLEINFEVNAFVYNEALIDQLSQEFLIDIGKSSELTAEIFAKRPRYHRLLEAVGRLVSPLQ